MLTAEHETHLGLDERLVAGLNTLWEIQIADKATGGAIHWEQSKRAEHNPTHIALQQVQAAASRQADMWRCRWSAVSI